jgi:hypothetical protein
MLLHAFHFDAGVLPPEITMSLSQTVSTTQKRTGGYSMRLQSGISGHFYYNAVLTLSGVQSEFYTQFAFYHNSLPTSNSRIFRWKSAAGTVLGGLIFNITSKKIEVYTGDFATLVATGSTVLNAATFYVIELYIKIADSGQITVRVDLTQDSNFSGDTKPGADTTVGLLEWGGLYNTAAGDYIYVDDIIIHTISGTKNNSWPNGGKVYLLVPTGDGATKQWTPSSGTDHWALIDEIPPVATDNLIAASNALVDILTLPNLPGEAAAVKAVIPETYALKGSAVAPTRLAVGIDINGEGVEYSADKDLTLTQTIVRNLWEERPGGGNFSVADITNMSLYLKSAA